MIPLVEKAMVDDGIILIKYFLNVSREEQTRRLESRIDDPRKIWKLSPTDLKSYSRRYDYLRARDAMFVATELGVGAVAHRGQRRQEARPAEHHLPPAEPDPVRAAPGPGREDAEAAERPRLRRAGVLEAQHPDAVLTRRKKDDLATTETAAAPSASDAPRRAGMPLPPEDVAQRLDVDPAQGLSAAKAAELLRKNGPNALPAEATTPGWQQFLAQYRSYMQIILVAAAVASMADRRALHRASSSSRSRRSTRSEGCGSRARPRAP